MSDNLKNQINDDIKAAMKGGDKKSLAALRLISAAIKQHEVDNREEVDDAVATNLLTKLAKQRRESIAQYEKADRDDLVEQEVFELNLISKYLPEAASNEDINQAIQAAIEQTSASSMKDMGKVMGILKSQLEGRADFGLISQKVKETLSG